MELLRAKNKTEMVFVYSLNWIMAELPSPLSSSAHNDTKPTELKAKTESPKRKARLTVGKARDTTHRLERLITTQMTNNWLGDGWRD